MKHKHLAAAAVTTVTALALTACGGGGEPADPVADSDTYAECKSRVATGGALEACQAKFGVTPKPKPTKPAGMQPKELAVGESFTFTDPTSGAKLRVSVDSVGVAQKWISPDATGDPYITKAQDEFVAVRATIEALSGNPQVYPNSFEIVEDGEYVTYGGGAIWDVWIEEVKFPDRVLNPGEVADGLILYDTEVDDTFRVSYSPDAIMASRTLAYWDVTDPDTYEKGAAKEYLAELEE